MRNSDDTSGIILLYLMMLAGPFGALVAVMFWLMQPTIIPNSGIMMAQRLTRPTIDGTVELAAREQMERAALEEARDANDADGPTSGLRPEPNPEVVQKPPKRPHNKIASRRPPSREPRVASERPQQVQVGSAKSWWPFSLF